MLWIEEIHEVIKFVVRQAPQAFTWPGAAPPTAGRYTIYSVFASLPYRPLTSFSPPADCSGQVFTLAPAGVDDVDNEFVILTRGAQATCFPPDTNITGVGASSMLPTFSPATCPNGWVTQTGGVVTLKQNTSESAAASAVTWGVCCFGTMELTTANGSLVLESTYCSGYPGRDNFVTIINGSSTISTSVSAVYQYPIAVAIRDRDREFVQGSSSTTSTNSIPLSASAAPASASTLPAQTAAANFSGPSAALSPGAIAGIAVGCVVGVLLVLVMAFLFWRRRRQQKKTVESKEVTEGEEDGYDKAELPGGGKERAELGKDGAVHEVHGNGKPPELENHVVAELDANWRGYEVGEQR